MSYAGNYNIVQPLGQATDVTPPPAPEPALSENETDEEEK